MIKYEEYKLMSDEEKLIVNEKNPIVINITKQEIKLNNTRKVDYVLDSLRNLTYKYKENIGVCQESCRINFSKKLY